MIQFALGAAEQHNDENAQVEDGLAVSITAMMPLRRDLRFVLTMDAS
jgi:hypothetical protein